MNHLKPFSQREKEHKEAIDNLQNLRLTSEEYTAYVMTLSNNAIALQMERQEKEEAVKEAVREITEKMARVLVLKALKQGKLSDLDIAEINGVSIEYVLNLKKELNQQL
jgi:molecular chaperone DnaK (HSP70)